MKVNIGNTPVYGINPDTESRCAHYHTDKDIIAIQFYCCGDFFCCYTCHETLCEHEAKQWPADSFHHKAILCGACQQKISISAYLHSENSCPYCSSSFNPGCRLHYSLYFQYERK